MTIFTDEAFVDAPLLTEWQIVGDPYSQPLLFGCHAFHEGTRVAVGEIVVVDPMLRWVITTHGAYRLAGGGTLASEYAKFGTQKQDHH